MQFRKRQLMGACVGTLAASSLPCMVSAKATTPLLVVVDIDAPGPRAAYKIFAEAVYRRFASAGIRPEVRLITAVPEANEKNAQDLKAALLAARADIILAANPVFAMMAGKFGLGTPILFFCLADPVAFGLTDSLTRPNKGMTGFTLGVSGDLKRREMLLRLTPRCRIVGLLTSSSHLQEGIRRSAAVASDPLPGVEQRRFDCENLEQLTAILKTRAAREVEAWDVEYVYVPFRYPGETVRQFNLLRRPVIYPRMKHVHMGGMAAYEPKIEEADEAWVSQVASLLAGVPIENIPVVQATRYSFGLNLKACRRVGIEPPKSLLKIADLVIE